MTQKEIQQKLFLMQDLTYKEFQEKLIPTVPKELVIGVRTPQLRSFAKDLRESPKRDDFLSSLPHKYYEEKNLHSIVIGLEKDYETCIEEINRYLPHIDNWATCDMLRPKCFSEHKADLLSQIDEWLISKHTYTIRFAIEMLMIHYLEDEFDVQYLEKVSLVYQTDYYVKMMIAWFFATALSKQWEKTIIYLEQNILEKWIHNKTIQKAIESRCITEEQKQYLRKLRV